MVVDRECKVRIAGNGHKANTITFVWLYIYYGEIRIGSAAIPTMAIDESGIRDRNETSRR